LDWTLPTRELRERQNRTLVVLLEAPLLKVYKAKKGKGWNEIEGESNSCHLCLVIC